MSRSSGGSISSALSELAGRARKQRLEADPLYRKAMGMDSKKVQQSPAPRRMPGRVMQRKGILQQGLA